jgi:ABC-type multidrug transport system fused ATPase/permease subunit
VLSCVLQATSNVDHATDALIHKTLKEAFGSSTVLTIAHRLHTIADVDLVLVLEAGRLLEQGSPAELMTVPGGAYRSLVERSRAARAHADHV